MRVLFMIPRDPPPRLRDRAAWSINFHDFLAKTLVKDPRLRPTALMLLQHKFVQTAPGTAALAELVQVAKARAAERARAAAAAAECLYVTFFSS
jgi:hypothetical protein